jgi:photosystem II stability/assembly factor-like uncharacterized protein
MSKGLYFRRAVTGLAVLATLGPPIGAQQATPNTPPAPLMHEPANPSLRGFRWRSIGPTSQGVRVDDIAVDEKNPSTYYVGYAVTGIVKTVNNGNTFEPIFDTYGSASIADIALAPSDPNIIYVATGEANNRQTTSYGDGMYKSTDGGKTFANIGLEHTQTIARIVIDPRNPNVLYVAAPGHLFGPSPDGALYKSTDAGATWTKSLFVDDSTGFTEVVMDPSNSNVLYAASYQRRRTSCCYNGGGPGSAMWKTTDGGKRWTKITGGGLPPGEYGRIAIDVSRTNPNIVYAQLEAGEARLVYPPGTPNVPPAVPPLRYDSAGKLLPALEVNTTPGGNTARYWCNNAASTPSLPANAPKALPVLDPNQSGVFRSDDGGRTWKLQSNCAERPMYFSQVRIDPRDPNTVYVAGGSLQVSRDGGKTFAKRDGVHSDIHGIWLDAKNPEHVIVGSDGSIYVSYDRGENWDFVNSLPTGQMYWVSADNERPYNLYTGLQDNGNWGGPSTSRARVGIINSDWFKLPCVGDGFVTAVNRDHPNIVYCEGQDGDLRRVDLNTGRPANIKPVSGPTVAALVPPCIDGRTPDQPRLLQRGGRRTVLNATAGDVYRFNWNTPFLLSPHNPDIVYLGGNRVFKSIDRGDRWVASADLTKQIDRCKSAVMGARGNEKWLAKNDGIEWYSTITALAESPVVPGIVWAGTDDGNLQVSRDGGLTFSEVGRNLPGLPENHAYWISRADASHFDAGTAYVAVDGHRSDDMKPYVFVTRDYGRTFQNIASNLPAYGNVQVVREDTKNKDLLFVGTEFGLFTSLDGGKRWEPFMTNMPTVRTDDILIHPRDGDLIAATHGRSLFIADDISALQQFTPAVAAQDVYLFEPREVVAYITNLTINPAAGGERNFIAENAPAGATIAYYLKGAAQSDVRVTVSDASGNVVATLTGPRTAGIHKLQTAALAAGKYAVTLVANGKTLTRSLTVLEDKWFKAR